MFFFPYRADLELFRVPLLTAAMCVASLVIYGLQASNERALLSRAAAFCAEPAPRPFRLALDKALGRADVEACFEMMLGIHFAPDKGLGVSRYAARAGAIAAMSPAASHRFFAEVIGERYRAFATEVPDYLTARLWYRPETWSPVRMLTAAFAHGSWSHVIGNLFFFFAFAATVEAILGWWRFVLVTAALAAGTAVAYSVSSLAVPGAPPSVGLSGVVMGMMAMFTFFLPTEHVRCFVWVIVLFKRVSIPAWILFAFYFGWDVYTLRTGDGKSGINLVAHVSGGVIGYGLGLALFRRRKAAIRVTTVVEQPR